MVKIDPVLVIDYQKLGTVPLDQWKQAIWEDGDQMGPLSAWGVMMIK